MLQQNDISPIQGMNGYSLEEVNHIIRDYLNERIYDDDLEIDNIVEVYPHGSRLRGTAKEDSDLDIVMFYTGKGKEDGLFNVLNDDDFGLEIDGIKVDINPIQVSTDMKEAKEQIESYKEKSMAYDKEILAGQSMQKASAMKLTDFNPNEAKIHLDKNNPSKYGEGFLLDTNYMIDLDLSIAVSTTLGSIYNSPKLYKAYPELKDYPVEFRGIANHGTDGVVSRGRIGTIDRVISGVHFPMAFIDPSEGKLVIDRKFLYDHSTMNEDSENKLWQYHNSDEYRAYKNLDWDRPPSSVSEEMNFIVRTKEVKKAIMDKYSDFINGIQNYDSKYWDRNFTFFNSYDGNKRAKKLEKILDKEVKNLVELEKSQKSEIGQMKSPAIPVLDYEKEILDILGKDFSLYEDKYTSENVREQNRKEGMLPYTLADVNYNFDMNHSISFTDNEGKAREGFLIGVDTRNGNLEIKVREENGDTDYTLNNKELSEQTWKYLVNTAKSLKRYDYGQKVMDLCSLQAQVDNFINYNDGYEGHLSTGDYKKTISRMRELVNGIPADILPKWSRDNKNFIRLDNSLID